jgi:hypothetical protein
MSSSLKYPSFLVMRRALPLPAALLRKLDVPCFVRRLQREGRRVPKQRQTSEERFSTRASKGLCRRVNGANDACLRDERFDKINEPRGLGKK